MTITLTPSQERAIEQAIRSGLVRSIDEFIDAAIEALPHTAERLFSAEMARNAGERIRELRKGENLQRGGMSLRELAHLEHKLRPALVLDVSACNAVVLRGRHYACLRRNARLGVAGDKAACPRALDMRNPECHYSDREASTDYC